MTTTAATTADPDMVALAAILAPASRYDRIFATIERTVAELNGLLGLTDPTARVTLGHQRRGRSNVESEDRTWSVFLPGDGGTRIGSFAAGDEDAARAAYSALYHVLMGARLARLGHV